MTSIPQTQGAQARAGRRAGSARFETYYKVQTWEATSLTWRDIQASHGSEAEARGAYPAGRRCRIMAVSMQGRAPVAGSDTAASGLTG